MLGQRLRRSALSVVFPLGCLLACGDDDSSDLESDAAAVLDASPEAGNHDDDSSVPEPDAGDAAIDSGGELSCEQRDEAFYELLVQHQSCTEDDECAVIGDCGPNADFRAIRADAAEEGYALMQDRCGGTYDGPGYVAICNAGTCELEGSPELCCGCADWDGGGDLDAGQ